MNPAFHTLARRCVILSRAKNLPSTMVRSFTAFRMTLVPLRMTPSHDCARLTYRLALVIACGLLCPALGAAYPTSLNIVPTVDLLDANTCRLEYENDGYSRLFKVESENYRFLQAGVSPRLEVGLDFSHAEGTDTFLERI